MCRSPFELWRFFFPFFYIFFFFCAENVSLKVKNIDFDETPAVLHTNFKVKSPCAMVSALNLVLVFSRLRPCMDFFFSLKLNVYTLNTEPTQMLI